MRIEKVPYHQTKYFSTFIVDYLSADERLGPYYNRYAKLGNFKAQIQEKQKQSINRKVLVEVLQGQYQEIETTALVKDHITSLSQENTFTVATGHQLCLFTGPLYFIYKIISTINLAETLKSEYPEFNFVPIYWMATEDHDFEEVNHVNLFGKKLEWKQEQKGGVGAIPTETLKSIFEELKPILGDSKEADELYSLFSEAYLEHKDLATATRYLVNALFAKYGLLILDADDTRLKQEAISLIKKDILEQSNQSLIDASNKGLGKVQAFVRPINFFYLQKGSRNRIEQEASHFIVLGTDLKFSKDDLETEIENHPERFSPNVLLRPLYKELLLPNLAMIGGGAEVNYWMQLKSTFEANGIVFPILILRNSALIVDCKPSEKIDKLGFSISDFFDKEDDLHKSYLKLNTELDLSIESELAQLDVLFDAIASKTTDKGLQVSVQAEKQKQIKVLKKIEQKLRKAEKQKHQISLSQISQLKNKLFPNNSLQERFDNIIPFYLKYGDEFIELLKKELNPLEQKFTLFIDE